MRVCVTGATGFVGSALVRTLVGKDIDLIALARKPVLNAEEGKAIQWRRYDLFDDADPLSGLENIDSVVHLAGLAHVVQSNTKGLREAFFCANSTATKRLARSAVDHRVRRFVFVSSIAVYGTGSDNSYIIDEYSKTYPNSLYGMSKLDAETQLKNVVKDSSMEFTIVRPALVVGPRAPGNLKRLADLIRRNLPLPIPTVDNERSYVGLTELIGLLISCVEDSGAAGQIFVAANDERPSTRQVINWIAEGMGNSASLVRFPKPFLKGCLRLIGKADIYDKLFGDLVVNASKASQVLGWRNGDSLANQFRGFGRAFRD